MQNCHVTKSDLDHREPLTTKLDSYFFTKHLGSFQTYPSRSMHPTFLVQGGGKCTFHCIIFASTIANTAALHVLCHLGIRAKLIGGK